MAQLGKLKEGLLRVIVQWSMRGLLRCHKAWALYACSGGAPPINCNAEPLSGDETDAPPPGVAVSCSRRSATSLKAARCACTD